MATEFPFSAPLTFAAGSVDRGTYTALPIPSGDSPAGAREGCPNALRVFAQMTTAAATGTIEVVITRNYGATEEVVYSELADVAQTGPRVAIAGASGNYCCSVTFSRTLNDYFDPVGLLNNKDMRVKIGCRTISAGSMLLFVIPTRK